MVELIWGFAGSLRVRDRVVVVVFREGGDGDVGEYIRKRIWFIVRFRVTSCFYWELRFWEG